MQLKERAELFRRGLTAGYLTLGEAVAWADRVVESEANPPIEVIELALASRRGVDEAISQLQSLTQGISSRELLGETVSDMRAALERDPGRARAIAKDLYGMALQRTFPPNADIPELYSVAYAFDPEEADWAPSGDEALQYLRDVLEKLRIALNPAP